MVIISIENFPSRHIRDFIRESDLVLTGDIRGAVGDANTDGVIPAVGERASLPTEMSNTSSSEVNPSFPVSCRYKCAFLHCSLFHLKHNAEWQMAHMDTY